MPRSGPYQGNLYVIDLSVRVSIRSHDDELVRFPVRLGLERDHAVVLTGFDSHRPQASLQLHHDLVRAVESGFDDGVARGPGWNPSQAR
jgi:hypothetical protein